MVMLGRIPDRGRQVKFWGSQTWKTNQFSGVNNAPASMKGYIDNVPSYACGAAWTSNPGNSSNPPSSVPVNMVVVVASAIFAVRVDGIRQHKAPRRGFGRTGYGPTPGTTDTAISSPPSAETPAVERSSLAGRRAPDSASARRAGQRKPRT